MNAMCSLYITYVCNISFADFATLLMEIVITIECKVNTCESLFTVQNFSQTSHVAYFFFFFLQEQSELLKRSNEIEVEFNRIRQQKYQWYLISHIHYSAFGFVNMNDSRPPFENKCTRFHVFKRMQGLKKLKLIWPGTELLSTHMKP